MANDNESDWEQDSVTPEEEQEESPSEDTPPEDTVVPESEEAIPEKVRPASEIESLATFSEQEGPFSYKILPEISGAGTTWKLVVYSSGVQGSVYQSSQGLTDAAADQLGTTRELQSRMNEALEYAAKNMHLPSELGGEERTKRSLHELESLMQAE